MKAIAKKGVEEEIVTNIGLDDPVMSTPLESDTSPLAEGSRAMREAPSHQGPDREPGAIVLGAHRWPRALHALGLTTNALVRLLRRATSSTEVVRSDRAVLPGHLCELCLDAPAVRLQPRPGVARWACVGPVRDKEASWRRSPSNPRRSGPPRPFVRTVGSKRHGCVKITARRTSLEACGGPLLQGVTVGRPSGAVPTVGSHCVGHAQAVRNRQGEASGGGDCPSR